MWLCGSVAGFVVKPCVGLWSDRCRSRFGRRRPFILAECLMISTTVILIAFSSDIGCMFGDTKEACSVYHGPRWRAAFVFVAGFWLLDLSNNAVQGPARALMAGLSGPHGCNAANAIFVAWMAIGNILVPLPSIKGSIVAAEDRVRIVDIFKSIKNLPPRSAEDRVRIVDIFKSIKNLPPGMTSVLLVTSHTWLSWFPFILYDIDWTGREVFHGDPKGTPS